MPQPASPITAITEVAFWVDDLDRAINFYRNVLGLELSEFEPGKHAFLRVGDLFVVLFNPKNPGTALADEYLARTGGPMGGLYHVAFKVAREQLDGFAAEIAAKGYKLKGPVDFGSGRRSWFLDDPDGHYLELTDR